MTLDGVGEAFENNGTSLHIVSYPPAGSSPRSFNKQKRKSPCEGTSEVSPYIPFATISLVKANHEAKPGSRGREIDHLITGGIQSGSNPRVWAQRGKEHTATLATTTFLL